MPKTSTRTYRARPCAKCRREFTPTAPRSANCNLEDCAAVAAGIGETSAPAADELTALDVIDRFGLDYNLGNVVRFVLEHDDGDERTNLESARFHIDRALAKLGGES